MGGVRPWAVRTALHDDCRGSPVRLSKRLGFGCVRTEGCARAACVRTGKRVPAQARGLVGEPGHGRGKVTGLNRHQTSGHYTSDPECRERESRGLFFWGRGAGLSTSSPFKPNLLQFVVELKQLVMAVVVVAIVIVVAI